MFKNNGNFKQVKFKVINDPLEWKFLRGGGAGVQPPKNYFLKPCVIKRPDRFLEKGEKQSGP